MEFSLAEQGFSERRDLSPMTHVNAFIIVADPRQYSCSLTHTQGFQGGPPAEDVEYSPKNLKTFARVARIVEATEVNYGV